MARNRLKLAPVELMLMKSVWRLGEATVQHAVDTAAPGDTVLVEPGRYVENIEIEKTPFVLGSRFLLDPDPGHIANTILDGILGNAVVELRTDSDAGQTELVGFTITNGTSLS